MARIYLFLGQFQKGIEVISPAPSNQAGVFGMLLYAETGQMAKAVEIARWDPGRPAYGFEAYARGYVLAAAGDRNGANEIWSKGLRYGEDLLARNGQGWTGVISGMLNAKLGRREQALRNTEQWLLLDPRHPVVLFFAAQTRALLGLRRESLDTLKAAVENGFFNLPMIEYNSRPGLSFHILRDDPEFHAIRADLSRRIDDLRARY